MTMGRGEARARRPPRPDFGAAPRDDAPRREPGVYRRPVDSSLIRSVGYDLPSSVLEIEFVEGGRVYEYLDVPLSVYSRLMAAASIGNLLQRIHPRHLFVSADQLTDLRRRPSPPASSSPMGRAGRGPMAPDED